MIEKKKKGDLQDAHSQEYSALSVSFQLQV